MIGAVGRVAIGAIGSILPITEPSEGYSALRASSTDRKSVTGAVGNVLPAPTSRESVSGPAEAAGAVDKE